MSIKVFTYACAIAALISTGCSNSKADDARTAPAALPEARVSKSDQAFAENAVGSGRLEMEHAQRAQAHASSAAVKEYAGRLLAAHTAANDQLSALLERKHIAMSNDAPREKRGSIGAKDDATTATKMGGAATGTSNPTGTTGASGTVATTGEARDRERAGTTYPWMQATGAAFDEGYIAEQIKAHQDAIALFEQQANSGTDADLKAFAAAQLPALRDHLREAETLQRAMRTTP
jgi:putative membrane protein